MSRLLKVYRQTVRRRLSWLGVRSSFYGEPGKRLHVYEFEGKSEGLDFMFVHGLGSDASAYGLVIPRLLPYARRLWAVELPGHGFSELIDPLPPLEEGFEMVATRLDELIERPVVLVGTSLGGAVALKYALRTPENVARLVLVSPAGAPMSKVAFDDLRALFLNNSIQGASHFLRRLYHRPPVYAPIMAWFIRSVLHGTVVKTFLDTPIEDSYVSADDVQSLGMDTLLLWGRSERILPHECLRWYQENMPDRVRIERPEGFGHAPHLECPEALVDRILEFTWSEP